MSFSNVNITIYVVNNDFSLYTCLYNVKKLHIYLKYIHYATINIKTHEICW